MATIKSLTKDATKSIGENTKTLAVYNMDDKYFSIWSFKKEDTGCSEGPKQNMQFDKGIARVLRDALNEFLCE